MKKLLWKHDTDAPTVLGWVALAVLVLALAVPAFMKVDSIADQRNARRQAAARVDGAAWAVENHATDADCEYAWGAKVPDARSHGLWSRYWLDGCRSVEESAR